jgi:hypothetical protein
VQAPFSSSSFNRFSYSWNNPIKYVDPSGYYADMSDAVDDTYGDYGGYDGGFGEGRCITKGETKDEVDPAGNVHYDIQYYNIDPCNQCRKKASNSHTGVSDGGGEGSFGYGVYSGPPDLGVVAPEFFLDPDFFIGGIGGIVKGSIVGFGFKSFRGLAPKSIPKLTFKPKWSGQVQRYRKGNMTAIEHITSRHSYTSGYSNVSKFSKGTGVKDIRAMVNEAAARGKFAQTRTGSTITHDFGLTIGTNQAGQSTSRITIHLDMSGSVRTAYPY